MSDHGVVETYDERQASTVVGEVLLQDIFRAEIFGDLRVENPPVAAPPSVDRLFDVSDDEYGNAVGLRHRISEQRQEIPPFAPGGILELVDHEVFEPAADLFVNERGLVVLDELREDVFCLREEQVTGFVATRQHLFVQVGEQGVAAEGLLEKYGCVVSPAFAVVEVAHLPENRLQTQFCGIDGFAERGFCGGPRFVRSGIGSLPGRGGGFGERFGSGLEIERKRP